MELERCISKRYPKDGHAELRESLVSVCQWFLDGGYGDQNSAQRLCNVDDSTYWQQLSEVIIAHALRRYGLKVKPRNGGGPDFLIERGGVRTWIEVICPEPSGVPESWLSYEPEGVVTMPHQELLQRYTAAIKQKAEVLIGADGKQSGYLSSGLIDAADRYVIAINGRLLRSRGIFPNITGISQWPFAAEAALGIGLIEVPVSGVDGTFGDPKQGSRYSIPKSNGSQIPTTVFLNDDMSQVSAIWSMDIDEQQISGELNLSCLVHNPFAKNPLPQTFLPAAENIIATIEEEEFIIQRI